MSNVTGAALDDLIAALADGTASRAEFEPFVSELIAREQVPSALIQLFTRMVSEVKAAEA